MRPSRRISPSIISGCAAKYSLTEMVSPRELVISVVCFQAGPLGSSPGSRLRRMTMSVVTSVLAFFLKASLGRRMAPEQVGLLGDVFPQGAVEFVERALGRDEQNQSAGPHLLQRGGEEVIVDDEVPVLEARVEGFVVPERDVADGDVVETVGQFGFLEGLMPDVGVGIERLCQAGGDRSQFRCR